MHFCKKQKRIKLVLLAVFVWCSLFMPLASAQQKNEDAERLGKALEYFTSQKYHECLMVMQDLDKHYRLNPRYKAYLGVCYYYEWDYVNAIKQLDEAIPQLENFAPHERSFYYWADAESYFLSQKYEKAIPLYEAMLSLCYAEEKADAYYRLGFCHLFMEEWVGAWNCFQKARQDYQQYFLNVAEKQSRILQIKHMIDGLKPKVMGNLIEQMLKGYEVCK